MGIQRGNVQKVLVRILHYETMSNKSFNVLGVRFYRTDGVLSMRPVSGGNYEAADPTVEDLAEALLELPLNVEQFEALNAFRNALGAPFCGAITSRHGRRNK